MPLTYEVVAKDKTYGPARKGELYTLYQDLIKLKEDSPMSKLVVEFPTRQRGERSLRTILEWCTADGYDLYHSLVPGETRREIYLEDKAAR